MNARFLTGLSLFLLAASQVSADPKQEATKPAEYVIGEMHVQTLPPLNFVYGSAETTFEKLGEVVNKYLPLLGTAIDEGRIRPTAGCMLVYRNMTDLSKPFTLEVGWLVSDKTKATAELKLRKTEPFKCATVMYTGAMANMGKVYEKLMGDVAAAGLAPSGESREMYLYWEGPDSVNNVVQVQLGVK
ncbi:MAG TPA: hypothetical protein VH475_29425 [Tepidisphaeraceae bacterium]|jgi:effector-binding domain-containing protein